MKSFTEDFEELSKKISECPTDSRAYYERGSMTYDYTYDYLYGFVKCPTSPYQDKNNIENKYNPDLRWVL